MSLEPLFSIHNYTLHLSMIEDDVYSFTLYYRGKLIIDNKLNTANLTAVEAWLKKCTNCLNYFLSEQMHDSVISYWYSSVFYGNEDISLYIGSNRLLVTPKHSNIQVPTVNFSSYMLNPESSLALDDLEYRIITRLKLVLNMLAGYTLENPTGNTLQRSSSKIRYVRDPYGKGDLTLEMYLPDNISIQSEPLKLVLDLKEKITYKNTPIMVETTTYLEKTLGFKIYKGNYAGNWINSKFTYLSREREDGKEGSRMVVFFNNPEHSPTFPDNLELLDESDFDKHLQATLSRWEHLIISLNKLLNPLTLEN